MPLYIVATPIGNLSDISHRALDILKMVDVILCEDTRQSSILLNHYGIRKPLESCHQYSEAGKVERIIERLHSGQNIALISDAGTPLISDPGFNVVRAVLHAGLKVIPIPGACAAITALSASGLPTHAFYFAGFLPAKQIARQKVLEAMGHRQETIILYEAPHRLLETLIDVHTLYPTRRCVLAKELTKQFENVISGTATDLQAWLEHDPLRQKGEFVLMLEGAAMEEVESDLPTECSLRLDTLLTTLAKHTSTKDAAKIAAEITGLSKNKLYERLLSK